MLGQGLRGDLVTSRVQVVGAMCRVSGKGFSGYGKGSELRVQGWGGGLRIRI